MQGSYDERYVWGKTYGRRKKFWDSGKRTCGICGKQVDSYDEFTIDHIIPTLCGGSNSIENLQPAHMACNKKKGSGTRLSVSFGELLK